MLNGAYPFKALFVATLALGISSPSTPFAKNVAVADPTPLVTACPINPLQPQTPLPSTAPALPPLPTSAPSQSASPDHEQVSG